MRGKLGWLVALTLLAVLASYSKVPKYRASVSSFAGSEDNIRLVLADQQAAWNRADIPAFLQGYWNSPDLTFSGSDGTVRGYDGVLERYRRSYPDRPSMGELNFSDLEIRMLGTDAALVLGKWHLKRSGGDVGGVFSLVFKRFPQGWRIIHDHTSAIKSAN